MTRSRHDSTTATTTAMSASTTTTTTDDEYVDGGHALWRSPRRGASTREALNDVLCPRRRARNRAAVTRDTRSARASDGE